jgi:hypothetical protein
MGKFIKNLFVFGVCCLFMALPVDWMVSALASRSDWSSVVRIRDVIRGVVNTDIIVLGNSRVGNGVSPSTLESYTDLSAWDLAVDGSAFTQQYSRYRLYRHFNRKPRLILLSVDNLTLSSRNQWEKEPNYPFFWNPHFRRIVFPLEGGFSFWSKYVPLCRYAGCLYHEIYQNKGPRETKGFTPISFSWDESNWDFYRDANFLIDEATVERFEYFLSGARSEGIPVVFFMTPILSEMTRRMKDGDKVAGFFKEFADSHGIPFLDYSEMFGDDKDRFCNPLHLNGENAEIFTDSLGRDISRVLLQWDPEQE